MMIKGAEIAMGTAIGTGFGLAAFGLRGSLGQISSRVANSAWAKRRETEGRFGGAALGKISRYGASSTFDARRGALSGVLKLTEKVAGIDLGHESKALLGEGGGFEEDRKRKVAKRQEIMKSLEVGEDEELTQAVRQQEIHLHHVETEDVARTDAAGYAITIDANRVAHRVQDAAGNAIQVLEEGVDIDGNQIYREVPGAINAINNLPEAMRNAVMLNRQNALMYQNSELLGQAERNLGDTQNAFDGAERVLRDETNRLRAAEAAYANGTGNINAVHTAEQ